MNINMNNNKNNIDEQGNNKKRKLQDDDVVTDNKNNNNNISLKDLEYKILDGISFYSIVEKLQLQNIGYEIPIEYVRFMILKLKYKDYISSKDNKDDIDPSNLNKLIPSKMIMLYWYTHYQSTDKYNQFCSLLGEYIKYTPISNSITKEEKRKRYIHTLSLYYKEYLIKPMILDYRIWPLNEYISDEEINNFNDQIEKKIEKRKRKVQQ